MDKAEARLFNLVQNEVNNMLDRFPYDPLPDDDATHSPLIPTGITVSNHAGALM